MEPVSNASRTSAVAAAAAHEFNNELTVILNGVARALAGTPPEDPRRELLLDVQAAGQRCAWKASGLLKFSSRIHHGPVYASFEYLIEQ